MNKRLVFILVCCIIIPSVAINANSDEAEDLFYFATKDLDSFKIFKAEEKFMKIINEYPETQYATYSVDKLINLYDETGKVEKIMKLYNLLKTKGVKLSNQSALNVAFHYIFTKKQQNEEAETILESLNFSQLSSREEKDYFFLTIVNLVKLRRFEEANKCIGDLLEKYPDRISIYFTIGVLSFEIGEAENMIEYFRKYSSLMLKERELDPEELRNLIMVENLYISTGRSDLAYEDLKLLSKIVSSQDDSYEILTFMLALSSYNVEKLDEAENLFENLKQSTNNDTLRKQSTMFLEKIKKVN